MNQKEAFLMRLSLRRLPVRLRVRLAVSAGALACASVSIAAGALDAVHPIHHAKSAQHLDASKTPVHSAAHPAAHAAPAHATAHSTAHPATRTAAKAAPAAVHGKLRRASLTRHHGTYERFTASSFVASQGDGDITAGEDPTIRAAAIDALGNMNGTAVVINPANGRVLAMVNAHMALAPGAEPCSTIKLSVGLAALSEGLVTRDTPVSLGGFRMNLTEALAHSNNLYFEEMGRELGFERVRHYATQFGLGELAGYNIDGEQLGAYPDRELPASEGGVGRMCSFGQGVNLTPLQLGAFVAAIANGGTLYYLQHPTTPEEGASFTPKVKRTLDIAKYVPEMQDGMAGAVQYGTARSLRANCHDFPVFGKTGTCSDHGTRVGWSASSADSPQGSLVTVFFLEGGRPTFGPRAAELSGEVYKTLAARNYFAAKPQQEAQAIQPASTTSSIDQPAPR